MYDDAAGGGKHTSAEGKELSQETQQVEGHEAFRERSSGMQSLKQPPTEPEQELLQHEYLLSPSDR